LESIDFLKNKLLENRKIHFLMAIALSILGGYLMVRVSPTFKVLIFLLPIMIIVLNKPKWGVYVLLTTIFYADWLSIKWNILPRAASWQIEMVIAILFLTAIARITLRNAKIIRTPLDKFFIILVAVGVVSHFINSSSPVITALGIRNTFKYPLFFYLLIQLDLDEKFYKNVIKYFIFLALIQILVTIIQSSIWTPEIEKAFTAAGKGAGYRYDFVTGTLGLGQSGALGLLMVNIICILIGFYLYLKKHIYLILSILLIIPMILGESRGSILFLPLVLLFLFKRDFFTRKVFLHLLTFGIIGVAILFSIFFISPVKEEGLTRYNPVQIFREHTESPTIRRARIKNIMLVNKIVSESRKTQLVGYGLGNASPSIFENYTGFIYAEYAWAHINNQQISWTMLELGYLGLMLFFIIIYQVYKINELFFLNQTKDKYWKAISFGFTGIIFIFVIGTIYTSVWYKDIIGFCFWFFSAAIFSVGKKKAIF